MKKFLKVVLVIILTILVSYLLNCGFKYVVMSETMNNIWELAEGEKFKVSIGNKSIYADGEEIIIDTVDEFFYFIKQNEKAYFVNTYNNTYNETSSYDVFNREDNKELLKELLTIEILKEGQYEEGKSQNEIYDEKILKMSFDPRYQITSDENNHYIFYICNNVVKVDKNTFDIYQVESEFVEWSNEVDKEVFYNSRVENLDGFSLIEEAEEEN